jgi:hypothetical protein
VLTVQQITPTVPTPRENGIIRSKVQYAGFCTGRWITISQPSIWTSPPANDDQFVAICDHGEQQGSVDVFSSSDEGVRRIGTHGKLMHLPRICYFPCRRGKRQNSSQAEAASSSCMG